MENWLASSQEELIETARTNNNALTLLTRSKTTQKAHVVGAAPYCQALDTTHLALWLALAKTDWMFADCEWNMGKLQTPPKQSMAGTGGIVYCIECHEPNPPPFAQVRLQERVHVLEELRKRYVELLLRLGNEQSVPAPSDVSKATQSVAPMTKCNMLGIAREKPKRTGSELEVARKPAHNIQWAEQHGSPRQAPEAELSMLLDDFVVSSGEASKAGEGEGPPEPRERAGGSDDGPQ